MLRIPNFKFGCLAKFVCLESTLTRTVGTDWLASASMLPHLSSLAGGARAAGSRLCVLGRAQGPSRGGAIGTRAFGHDGPDAPCRAKLRRARTATLSALRALCRPAHHRCVSTLRATCGDASGDASGASASGTGATVEVPVIDIAAFMPDAPASSTCADDKRSAAKAMYRACTDGVGAFHIVGHGIPAEFQTRGFQRAAQFFGLPDDVKRAIGTPPAAAAGFTRGYIGMGEESGSDLLEVKEAFSYGCVRSGASREGSTVPLRRSDRVAPLHLARVYAAGMTGTHMCRLATRCRGPTSGPATMPWAATRGGRT